MKTVSHEMQQSALRQCDWLLKEVDGLPLVFSPLLSRFPKLVHAFSTRLGGETKPPMESFNVGRLVDSSTCREDLLKNRSRLCSALGLNAASLIVPDMTHSNVVLFVEKPQPARPQADGIATTTPGLPLLLTFADCVPIIIFDPVGDLLAVVHAGWRGTASGIVQEAVSLLVGRGSQKSALVAAIGPAIGSCCYPTGWDAASQLIASLLSKQANVNDSCIEEANPNSLMSTIRDTKLQEFFLIKDETIHPDLKAINALQLLQAGVEQIDITNFCTACKPELFYSHRQSQGEAGRQAALACLN
jgi:polyphenol oxidase